MNISRVNVLNNNFSNLNVNNDNNSKSLNQYQPTFQAKGGNKEASKLTKWLAKHYGKWILNNKYVRKGAEWLANVDKTNATKHFQVAGSLITSSAYAINTLKNDNFEKENATTLAINHGLGWIIPTTLGYLTDGLILAPLKKAEYKYSFRKKGEIARAKLQGEAAETAAKQLRSQLKGFRTLGSIATFTLLYRYIAPVAITPLANMLGNKLNESKKKKQQQLEAVEQQTMIVQMQPKHTEAKEVQETLIVDMKQQDTKAIRMSA